MATPESTAQPRQPLQVTTGDDVSRGRFSNNLLMAHSAGEFILDWILNSPSGRASRSRSPRTRVALAVPRRG